MTFLKTLPKNPIIFGSALFFVANAGSSFFGYLFQLFTARFLDLPSYGELVSLFAFLSWLVIPLSILNPAIVKRTSEYKAKGEYSAVTQLLISAGLVYLVICAILFLGITLFSKELGNWLNIRDLSVFLPFSFLIVGSIFSGLPYLILQGLLRFKGAAFINSISNLFKLIFGIVGIVLIGGVAGSFWGLGFGFLMVFAIGLAVLKKNLIFKGLATSNFFKVRSLFKFAVPAILITAPITFLSSADIIFAKHFFNSETAGIYAGVSVVGRIIFFAMSAISAVFFPVISEKWHKGEDVSGVFKKAIVLNLLLLSFAIIIYNLFPNLIIKLLHFGDKYSLAVSYLGKYSIFISLISLINLVATFYLATSSFKYGFIPVIGSVLFAVTVFISSITINNIIDYGIISSLVILALSPLYHKYVFVRNSSGVQAGKNN